MQCQNCKRDFEGQAWQKVCKTCYAASKSAEQPKANYRSVDTERSIVRQVLYKVAAELLEKGATASKVNGYVQELEQGFYNENKA